MDNTIENDQVVQGLVQLSSKLLEEVVLLKQKNGELERRIDGLSDSLKSIIDSQKIIVKTIDRNQHEVKSLATTMVRSIDNVKYEIDDVIETPIVLSIEETVNKIVSESASICRYGDGEFSIMAGNARQPFQKQDESLRTRLIEVLNSHDDKTLIAIADNYRSLSKYSDLLKNDIRYYMTENVRKSHRFFLEEGRAYYNAYITTPYMLYNDKNTEGPQIRFNRLKAIWDKRDIVLIEGSLSRLGVGNDLFENAKSVRRILCPPENAYSVYDDILAKALEEGDKCIDNNLIFLISLGPAATVLAYDIAKAGFQAIDIGHIDYDYELFLRKTNDRIVIPGKYINNLTSVNEVADIDDENYFNQIIVKID